MAKVGKPSLKITDEMVEKAESLAAAGLTMYEIAQCLGMGQTTLYEKKAEYPKFAEAINRGKCKGIAMMSNNLVKLAKAGNAAANIFWLKARAKWKERDEEVEDMVAKATKLLDETKAIAAKCLQAPHK